VARSHSRQRDDSRAAHAAQNIDFHFSESIELALTQLARRAADFGDARLQLLAQLVLLNALAIREPL
jgi:hypothetical protein